MPRQTSKIKRRGAFAELIHSIFQKNGWMNSEFEPKVSSSTIQKINNQNYLPRLETVARITQCLDERKVDQSFDSLEKLWAIQKAETKQTHQKIINHSAPKTDDGLIVFQTKQEWWATELPQVIETSEELTILDSHIGDNIGIWSLLAKRLSSTKPFFLTIALLPPDESTMINLMIRNHQKPKPVALADKRKCKHLIEIWKRSKFSKNMRLRFYTWSGISPGPLVRWKSGESVSFGLGLWQQILGSPDLSPFLLVRSGSIHDSLEAHYKQVVQKFRGLVGDFCFTSFGDDFDC